MRKLSQNLSAQTPGPFSPGSMFRFVVQRLSTSIPNPPVNILAGPDVEKKQYPRCSKVQHHWSPMFEKCNIIGLDVRKVQHHWSHEKVRHHWSRCSKSATSLVPMFEECSIIGPMVEKCNIIGSDFRKLQRHRSSHVRKVQYHWFRCSNRCSKTATSFVPDVRKVQHRWSPMFEKCNVICPRCSKSSTSLGP